MNITLIKPDCVYGPGCLVMVNDDIHKHKFNHTKAKLLKKCQFNNCLEYRRLHCFVYGDNIPDFDIMQTSGHVSQFYHDAIIRVENNTDIKQLSPVKNEKYYTPVKNDQRHTPVKNERYYTPVRRRSVAEINYQRSNGSKLVCGDIVDIPIHCEPEISSPRSSPVVSFIKSVFKNNASASTSQSPALSPIKKKDLLSVPNSPRYMGQNSMINNEFCEVKVVDKLLLEQLDTINKENMELKQRLADIEAKIGIINIRNRCE